MVFSRTRELNLLNKLYEENEAKAVVFYGNKGNSVSNIVKEFITEKDYFYYDAVNVSSIEQEKLFTRCISDQIPKLNEICTTYEEIFQKMKEVKCEKRVIVIENFQNIIKKDSDFINQCIKWKKDKWNNQPVMFIFVSDNQYFVETQMAEKLEDDVYFLSGLIKVSDLTFLDIVRQFENYSLAELVFLYSIFGGKSGYLEMFDPLVSVKENIINKILTKDSFFYNEGKHILPEELREHSVYNTLLLTIASGKEKLNEIHKDTGFSRPKISVYLKNLIEFDLIEKIDSYDTLGKENAQKGIYKIKDRFISFYYKYIYSHYSELKFVDGSLFYDKYINPSINSFSEPAFLQVCREYLELLNNMDKLPIRYTKSGTWIGKVGDIHIILQNDTEHTIVGQCSWETGTMTYEDFEWLSFCVKQAKLEPLYYYLFSADGFDEKLKKFASENQQIFLIDATML